jgi:hypothetical protein
VTKLDREARDEMVRELETLLAEARKGRVVAFAALARGRKTVPTLTLVGDYEELFDALDEASDLLDDDGDGEAVSICTPS